MWTLKDHGDSLEKNYWERINQMVPAYELIWSKFIGNNGQNQMVEIQNIPTDKKDFRIHFSEHHYTIIESILCLDLISDEVKSLDINNKDVVLRVQNYVIAFFGHMGRIYDNVKQVIYYSGKITGKIREDLTIEEIDHDKRIIGPQMSDLISFYYERHVVLHGKKVPIGLDESGDVSFADISEFKGSPKGWDKNMKWRNVEEVKKLRDILFEIVQELPIRVDAILQSIKNDILKFLKEEEIAMPEPSLARINEPLWGPGRIGIDVYNIQTSGSIISGAGGFPESSGNTRYTAHSPRLITKPQPKKDKK